MVKALDCSSYEDVRAGSIPGTGRFCFFLMMMVKRRAAAQAITSGSEATENANA